MSLSKSLAGALSRGSSSFTWHSMQELFFWLTPKVNKSSTITVHRTRQTSRAARNTAYCRSASIHSADHPQFHVTYPTIVITTM